MSKKSQKYRLQKPKVAPQQVQKKTEPVKKQPEMVIIDEQHPIWLKWALLAGIIIITFYCYRYSLKNQFTNWDDGAYVTENPYIKNLTHANMHTILYGIPTPSNYHPLTILSLAANYHYSKLSPEPYYITNICIHIINTCLVFFFLLMLFRAMQGKGYGPFDGAIWFAALGALWHGIHPMHVESVAWVSERKDVLYTFFYLLGLIVYLKYVEEEKIKLLVYVFLLFALSNLSKAMAVVFPLSLFAFDFLLKRKIEWKLLFEKVPFFLFSLLFGWYTFSIQQKSGAVASFHTFTVFQRVMFACYSFIMYLAKAFVPAHLCSFYPYPNTDPVTGNLPLIFYLSPLIVLFIIGLPLFFSYRANNNYFRVVATGFAFYFFNVLLILQFISVGATIMSERYTYVAYLGIIFMVVYFLQVLIKEFPSSRQAVLVFAVVSSSILAYLCYDRTQVWHSTKTLWQDVIKKYPFRVQTSYKNLGNYYADLGPTNPIYYDSAFTNYEILVKIHMADAGTYSNIANIYGLRKQFDKSLEAYNEALKLDSNSFDAHLDRAITLSIMKKYDLAIKDYDFAYRIKPNSEKLLENRASTYLNAGQYANAVADYTNLITINPDNPNSYISRGAAEFDMGNYKAALPDFIRTHSISPGNTQCMYNMAVTYEKLGDYKNALSYALMAQKAKFPVSDNYIKQLQQQAAHPSAR